MLTFSSLVLYLLNLRKASAQVELDQFFKHVEGQPLARQAVTKSAFFQARQHLSHEAFSDLNRSLVDDLYSKVRVLKKWRGFRLCAVDGSKIRLPNTPDVISTFGVHTGRSGQADCAMGLASVFFDVLNHVAIDARLAPGDSSERELAGLHLEQARTNDLVLYDRGYNAFWLYAEHRARGVPFCMRAKVNRGKAFKAFADSGERERVIILPPNRKAAEQCERRGLSAEPMRLRLVRVDLPGEVEVLVTNLFDCEHYPAPAFKALYHLRWHVEELYKRLKQWVEIENFSGKSERSVRQDFHANILASNLTTLMAIPPQIDVDEQHRQRNYRYQVNFAQALSKMKHTLVTLITGDGLLLLALIERTIHYIAQTIEPVKDGRSFPRRQTKMKNKIHYMAYKRAI